MNKKNKLIEKIGILISEIECAQRTVSVDKKEYLEMLKKRSISIIELVNSNTLPVSNGGVLGASKCISQFDDLANITSLYNAAHDVDSYYMRECRSWD